MGRATPERSKILLISSNFPPVTGGASTVYENICRKSGGRVVALTAERDYTTGKRLEGVQVYAATAGHPVHRIELLRPLAPGAAGGGGSKWRDLRLMAAVLWRVSAICFTDKVRVVCLGDLVYGGWLAFPLKYLLGRKVVIYVHGEEITTASGGGVFDAWRRRFLAHADSVVAVSRFTADALVRLMGVKPTKITLISNGVDLAKFAPSAEPAAAHPATRPPSRRIILTVGRLVPRKGMDRLIEAMPSVLSRCPEAHLLVAGHGPQRAELEQIVDDLGLQDHVTFLGRVADAELKQLYERADVFALPNREMPDGDTEGFGLVFLEANAFGTPVVAGSVGGAIDAVTDGVNGLVVNGDRASEVAHALCRVLLEPDLRARLSGGAIKVARESDWSIRVRQFLDLCDRL